MNNILVDTCDHEYIYYGNKLIIYDPIDDCWEECYFVSEAEANTAFELFNENGIKMQKKRKN